MVALTFWLHGGITVGRATPTANPSIFTAFSPIGLGFDLSGRERTPPSAYQTVDVVAQDPADTTAPVLPKPTGQDTDWCEVLRIHNGQIGVSMNGSVKFYPNYYRYWE